MGQEVGGAPRGQVVGGVPLNLNICQILRCRELSYVVHENVRDRVSLSVGLNVVYWLSGVGSAQAANTSAALKPLFFQRGPVIWKVGVNVALGLDVADVCCQFGKVH